MHLSLEPGFLLQFFRKKREAVLGGRLPSKFSLETEIALYNSYISQMEHELACSKEKGTFPKDEIGRPKGCWNTSNR